MRILSFYITCVVLVSTIHSCAYQELYDHKNNDPVRKIDYFELKPKVFIVNGKNQLYYQDSLSTKQNNIIDSLLIDNRRLRINNKLSSPYDFEQKEIAQEISNLEKHIESYHSIKDVHIPPAIRNFMDREESDIMAISIVNGYVRSGENIEKGLDETILINLITVPLTGTVFVSSKLTDPFLTYYRFVVFDKRCDCVRYYRNYPKLQHSILNDRKLKEQINSMYRNMYMAID